MTKKKKEDQKVAVDLKEYALDHLALGLTKLENGKFGIVEIAYSPISGESSVESIHTTDTKAKANELFKILAVKMGILK